MTRYYAVLVEAYAAGLRFSQIAERVGTSGGAVRRVIARELGDDVVRVRHQSRSQAAVSDETVSTQE